MVSKNVRWRGTLRTMVSSACALMLLTLLLSVGVASANRRTPRSLALSSSPHFQDGEGEDEDGTPQRCVVQKVDGAEGLGDNVEIGRGVVRFDMLCCPGGSKPPHGGGRDCRGAGDE